MPEQDEIAAATAELAGLRAALDRLAPEALARGDVAPGALQLLESLRVALEELGAAQRELERRDEELSASRESRAEERTRELSAMLEHLPLGVTLIDADGRVLRYNRRATELVGTQREKVERLGEHVAEVSLPDGTRAPEVRWPWVRAFLGEVVVGERLHIRTSNGAAHFYEVSAAPVESRGGKIVSVVLVFQDIAERERRDQTVRTFVTNAAHELGTPVAGIIAAVEALQAGAKEEPADRERFLGHIARESARLERLMRALLVLARAQARTEPARLVVVPLEPLVAEVARAVVPRDGVRVDVSCPSDVAAVANRPLLEQALLNLTSNAARYTERGEIRLSAETVDGEVEVVVSDTGPGIPAAVQERLFERFVRGQTADGFGLGLAIARDSVEATGGSLRIESSPQTGTRAVVRLPGARLVAEA